VLAAAVALASFGCTGKNPFAPGEPVGVFEVEGKLVTSSCGAALDPWQFDVRLRHEQRTLYWVQGGLPISGPIDANARVVLKASTSATVRAADAKTKTNACTIARSDVVDLVLAPVASPGDDVTTATSFQGTLTYRFSPTQGSSCDDQLAEAGGDYAALPCDVTYELRGTRTKVE